MTSPPTSGKCVAQNQACAPSNCLVLQAIYNHNLPNPQPHSSAWSNLKKQVDQQAVMEQQELIFFLANKNSIITNLKTRLAELEGYKEVLVHITNVCIDNFEQRNYLLPIEKHMYLKAVMPTLFLMDTPSAGGKKDDKGTVAKLKKLKLDRILRLFRKWPVIPLVNDMHIETSIVFKLVPSIDSTKMAVDAEDDSHAIGKSFLVVHQIDDMKQTHQEYISKLALLKLDIAKNGEAIDQLPAVVLEGMHLLSTWTCQILEQVGNWRNGVVYLCFCLRAATVVARSPALPSADLVSITPAPKAAWKSAKPTDQYLNPDCPPTATDYERVRCRRSHKVPSRRHFEIPAHVWLFSPFMQAVRYNYSHAERIAMVELLAMLYDVKSSLMKISNLAIPAIK